MKFTVISHASIYLEFPQTSILFDPWLLGSSYWRSWWNFPEPDRNLINSLKPDYIYITHLHWDHYHGPSLKLFPKDTKIIFPYSVAKRMVRDIKGMGFKNIIEIPHGKSIELEKGVNLYSYQFGPCFVDSGVIVDDGTTTIFNTNDAKFFGKSLKQITSKFKKSDFVFRSHSSASSVPYCIENYQDKFPNFRTKKDYIEEFFHFSVHIQAKYAIPFASNHCYLHKETKKFNNTTVSPVEVSEYYNGKAESLNLPTKCVVMSPGSSWSSKEGFDLVQFPYANKEQEIQKLASKYSEKLNNHYALENSTTAEFKYFKNYFSRFFKKTPYFLKFLYGKSILFIVVEKDAKKYWEINFKDSSINERKEKPHSDIEIEMSAFVTMECVRKRLFNTWGPSKRMIIRLNRNNTPGSINTFYGLLDMFENDYFPIFRKRLIFVFLTRWRELITLFTLAFKTKVLRKPLDIKRLYPLPK